MITLRPRCLALAVPLLLVNVGPGAPAPRQDPAPALPPVTTVEGITEHRLDNGLRVLLFPDPSAATVTVNITYMVGSRHEGRGEKGMAHLLEHMLFKGTGTRDDIWQALEAHGARPNGTTWVDRTNYYETMPAGEENLRFAIGLEADRMINSTIAADDLAAEMTVVRNEFEIGESNPVGILMERLLSAAFLWHNYGHSTIGNRSDIERVPIEKLRAFYERYYQPDNAVVVVAGQFEPALALELIAEHFGPIPRPERTLDASYTEEPPQDGPRFVTLRRTGSAQAAGAVYHIPAGSHPDFPAIQILAEALSAEPSGRLYEALVPADLAFRVAGFPFAWAEPGVVIFLSNSRTEQDVQAAHDRLIEVVESSAGSITADDVERARTALLKDIRLALTDSGRIGIELTEWQALGDWRMFFVHRDRLKAVTLDDVQRVAGQYLLATNRTSGIFVPTDEPARVEIPATPEIDDVVSSYSGTEQIAAGEAFEPTPENIERRTTRLALPNGMKIALLPRETRGDSVMLSMRLHYGTEEALQPHVTPLGMLPAMLMRGTTRLDYQQLRDEIDRLQSRVVVSGDAGDVQGTIVSDRAHLVEAIALLAEILRQPAFDAEEFQQLQARQIAMLEQQLTEPQGLLGNFVSRRLSPFPPQSFHYVPTLPEKIRHTKAVTLEELRHLHDRFFGASHCEVAVVGDFDPSAVREALDEHFGSWIASAPYAPVIRPYRPVEPVQEVIETPGKANALIARGTVLELHDEAPDFPAMELAAFVLGGSPSSRLMQALRHEAGLSYGAGAQFDASERSPVAILVGFAACAPQNAMAARQIMQAQFARWIDQGLDAEEVEEARANYRLQLESRLADDGSVAMMLAALMEVDRTFEYYQWLLEEMAGLDEAQIDEAIRRHLAEKAFADVVVGDVE